MDRSRHLDLLTRLVAAPHSSRDIDALVDRVLDLLTTITGHELSSVHVYSSDYRTLHLRGDRGLSARLREVNQLHVPGEGLIGRVALTGQAIHLRRVTRSPHLLPAARRVVQAEGIRGFACVPIRSAGRVLGTLSLGRPIADAFTADDTALLEVTAGHVAAVLAGARRYAALQERLAARQEPYRPPARSRGAPAETIPAHADLLAEAASELRRSHQSMLGWVRLLQQGRGPRSPLSAHGLAVLQQDMTGQVQRLGDLVDLSHIVTGTLPCDRRHVDLLTILEDALGTAVPAAARIDLVTEVAACPVLGDARRLQQVVATLIADAAASTEGEGARIVVRLERRADCVRVSVNVPPAPPRADLGTRSGVPARPRGPASAAGDPASLAIVQHLVALHGGTLCIERAGTLRYAAVVELPACRS